MKYHTTIFRQMLGLFSRLEFQNIVNRYKGDFHVRNCRCWDQMIHLMFSQFSSRDSLRETTDTMHSQYRKHYHLGVRAIPRSTLSDANTLRDYRIYHDLFFVILYRVQRVAPKYKLNLDRDFFILDSTTIDLCLKLFPWARFRKAKAAVKIHTLMQAAAYRHFFGSPMEKSTIRRSAKKSPYHPEAILPLIVPIMISVNTSPTMTKIYAL